MTKIQVPDNAESILDEIVRLAEEVESNNNYYHEYPDLIGHEEFTKFNQDYDNLINKIDTLGHRWCLMNPIKYNCTFDDYYPQSKDLWFYEDNAELPQDAIEHCVPHEIYQVIKIGTNHESHKDRSEFVTRVRQLLSSLKEKVIVQNRQSANLAKPDHSKVINQDEKNEIVKPRLINAGRTIKCSKGTFDFTVQQAKVIKIMWKKGINSQEFYQEQEILEEAGIGGTSFANVFKSRKEKFNAIFEQHKSMRDCWRLNLG